MPTTTGCCGSSSGDLRNHAIQRALGTTPVQTVTAFLVAHLAACLVACALGIPLGIAFYATSIRDGILDPIGFSPLTYVATILTAVLLYAVIAFIPTRFLARRRIAPQLTYE